MMAAPGLAPARVMKEGVVMKKRRVSRRDFLYLGIGGGLLTAGYPLVRAVSQSRNVKKESAFIPTPGNTLGPFYRKGAPRREKLFDANSAGVPLMVAGRVINTEGTVLAGAILEVFHADAEGEYDMRGFNYRGEIPVNASGEYRYETVVPGGYGGRAQHIHYVINAPGHRRLVTQLYFESDPKFEGNADVNYNRDSLVWHRELIRPVTTVNKNKAAYSSVSFDICMEKA